MARFPRTTPAPEVTGAYGAFRPYVRQDFHACCAYCLMHEFWAGGERNFELDHFQPVSLFPERERDFYNLYYACHVCNQAKSDHWPPPTLEARGIGFVDLCADDWETHFRLLPDGNLTPLTEAARYTLLTLRLNSEHLVALRTFALRHQIPLDVPPSE